MVGNFNAKIKFYDHHLTHKIYGIVLSNFNNAIVLSYDGGGENTSTEISLFKNSQIKDLKKYTKSTFESRHSLQGQR